MKKVLSICMLIATIFIFFSCDSSGIVVTTRPSPPVYVRPAPPGAAYVWIEGDWVRRSGRYHWREGHWARTRNRVWINGNWESRGNGWYWRRGHWR